MHQITRLPTPQTQVEIVEVTPSVSTRAHFSSAPWSMSWRSVVQFTPQEHVQIRTVRLWTCPFSPDSGENYGSDPRLIRQETCTHFREHLEQTVTNSRAGKDFSLTGTHHGTHFDRVFYSFLTSRKNRISASGRFFDCPRVAGRSSWHGFRPGGL